MSEIAQKEGGGGTYSEKGGPALFYYRAVGKKSRPGCLHESRARKGRTPKGKKGGPNICSRRSMLRCEKKEQPPSHPPIGEKAIGGKIATSIHLSVRQRREKERGTFSGQNRSKKSAERGNTIVMPS